MNSGSKPLDAFEKAANKQLSTQIAKIRSHQRLLWSNFAFVSGILIISLTGLLFQIGHLASAQNLPNDTSGGIVRHGIRKELNSVSNQIKELEDAQSSYGIRVVDATTLQTELTAIQFEMQAGELKSARNDIMKLHHEVADYQAELAVQAKEKLARAMRSMPVVQPIAGTSILAPILIYHYTPADFETQLLNLIQKGYTSIDLDTLAAAIATPGSVLPAKPVVITFDDGFGDQMKAFELLKKYNMKATYYIIVGGAASNYCIGAGRKYDQTKGCGDAYLSWDQVRLLDTSGLVTIAAHTVDHLNLVAQSPEMQRYQIFDGKSLLEAQLGHPVRHFAFPYGSYNASTEALVREAGFTTAVSTLPGTIHTSSTLYSLHRVRDVYHLP